MSRDVKACVWILVIWAMIYVWVLFAVPWLDAR